MRFAVVGLGAVLVLIALGAGMWWLAQGTPRGVSVTDRPAEEELEAAAQQPVLQGRQQPHGTPSEAGAPDPEAASSTAGGHACHVHVKDAKGAPVAGATVVLSGSTAVATGTSYRAAQAAGHERVTSYVQTALRGGLTSRPTHASGLSDAAGRVMFRLPHVGAWHVSGRSESPPAYGTRSTWLQADAPAILRVTLTLFPGATLRGRGRGHAGRSIALRTCAQATAARPGVGNEAHRAILRRGTSSLAMHLPASSASR